MKGSVLRATWHIQPVVLRTIEDHKFYCKCEPIHIDLKHPKNSPGYAFVESKISEEDYKFLDVNDQSLFD
ncbi:hypothetical protein QJS10_CPB20g02035 [Acorus calamus]|uniref:Uncharacterized protein n=1 Tax=Acorus calamus TaxID=4465 RepID=A0AAV9CAN6_ACOCL|nr:hypothetical protein QJS10_CPB20g02035 [Acorus calamus]